MYNPTQKNSNFKSRKGKLMAKFMRKKRPQLQSSVQGFLPQLSQEASNSQMFLVCDSFLLYFKKLCVWGRGALSVWLCIPRHTYCSQSTVSGVSFIMFYLTAMRQASHWPESSPVHKWGWGQAGGCEHSRAACLQPSMVGLQEHTTIPSFLCDGWNLNSGPHTCRSNTITS